MPNASYIRAGLDYARTNGLITLFEDAATRHDVPLALLMAVASQETRLGRNMGPNGKGDSGHAWGIMQIHDRYHPVAQVASSPYAHAAIIDYGARLLARLYQRAGSWRGALARYNSGDEDAAGRAYASEVLARRDIIADALGFTLGGDSVGDLIDWSVGLFGDRPAPGEPGQDGDWGALAATGVGAALIIGATIGISRNAS